MKAIESVLNQSYKNFELIIVDDGSTDNTKENLDLLIQENKIKYIRQNNSGVASARNLGIKNSSGDYIAFLDSDDEWVPNKLQKQVDFFNKNPNFKIVYTDETWVRNGKRVNQKAIHKKSGGQIFKECIQQCLIGPSTVMIKKELLNEVGHFDESFKVCEDYDLWLKISSLYEIGYIEEALVIKNGGHVDQLSTTFVAMDMWRIKAILNILKTRKLNTSDKNFTIDSVVKRAGILKQGYKKHDNLDQYNQVDKILNEVKNTFEN
jgi:glycosyltransferase involved in cell wall biosynthesis